MNENRRRTLNLPRHVAQSIFGSRHTSRTRLLGSERPTRGVIPFLNTTQKSLTVPYKRGPASDSAGQSGVGQEQSLFAQITL